MWWGGGSGERGHQLVTESDPRPQVKLKERSDSTELSSALHRLTVAWMCVHTSTHHEPTHNNK